MIPRPILHQYADPLSIIWLACAKQVGYRVVRTAEAYASTDGKRTLLIAEDAMLDADDSLAQMILHELCHALVEGEQGEQQVDWGLDNTSSRDIWREHACLRLQAYLAGSVGMRDFFAPTTDFRVKFWNQLPADPLMADASQGGRREPSCVAARIGAWRASMPRWQLPLQAALSASATIASAVQQAAALIAEDPIPITPVASRHNLTSNRNPPLSLWAIPITAPALHPAGHASVASYYAQKSCADCAWSFNSRNHLRCQHAPSIKLAADAPACTRWEPTTQLDCQTCGACCREAYDRVEVGAREAVIQQHPELILRTGKTHHLKRTQQRCSALIGGHTPVEAYRCSIYVDRPNTCRAFTQGSDNCLQARRKVGLSL